MPSSSTVPAAKAALVDAFSAWAGLNGVTVAWGRPTAVEDVQYEMVFLGRVEREKEDRGFGTSTEDYTIQVVVQSYKHGDDERATEERLWEIHGEVEAAITADTTLGGVLNETGARVERTREETEADPEGWLKTAFLDVRCRSVLTD